MSNVQFQDQQNVYKAPKQKGFEQMVISLGLAKDKKGAQVVLLIITVLAVATGLFFMVAGGTTAKPENEFKVGESVFK